MDGTKLWILRLADTRYCAWSAMIVEAPTEAVTRAIANENSLYEDYPGVKDEEF